MLECLFHAPKAPACKSRDACFLRNLLSNLFFNWFLRHCAASDDQQQYDYPSHFSIFDVGYYKYYEKI